MFWAIPLAIIKAEVLSAAYLAALATLRDAIAWSKFHSASPCKVTAFWLAAVALLRICKAACLDA